MSFEEKVVGVHPSIRPQKHYLEYKGTVEMDKNLPILVGRALLRPEPINPFDPTAYQVFGELKDGSTHLIGYIPKASALKQKLNGPTVASLIIKAYSEVGDYSDSYRVSID